MLGTLILSIKMDFMDIVPRNYLFLCFGKVYTVKRVTWVAAIALFQDFRDQFVKPNMPLHYMQKTSITRPRWRTRYLLYNP